MPHLPLQQVDFDKWIRPSEAIAELRKLWTLTIAIDAITGRLRNGLVQAYAGTSVRELRVNSQRRMEINTLVPVPAQHWSSWASRAASTFWNAGDVTLYDRSGQPYASYHDVRFHPRDFAALVPPEARQTEPEARQPRMDDRPSLSQDDAERFSRAILCGWPQSTEDFAHKKAVLFFPDHKISRDWFRVIFRAIRGPKSRGKQRKT